MQAWTAARAASIVGLASALGACGSGGSSGAGAGGASTGPGAGGAGTTTSASTTTSSATTSSSTTGSSSTSASSSSAAASSSGSSCPGMGDPCTACAALTANCGATYCTCADDPACVQIITCVQACPQPPTTSCEQACLDSQDQNGISEALLLSDCTATHCTSTCPMTTPLTPCEKCLFTSCASQMNTCLANSECAALIQCVQACPSGSGQATCQQNCGFAHFGGVSDGQAVQSCASSMCAAAPASCP